MPNLTTIGVSAGVPNSGTGTVSTIDALMAIVATAAAQATGNTSLASILTALQAALPLPTGASTSALQTTGNTSLSTIAAAITAATGTITSVASANTDTTILASNTGRKGATIFNDSTALLYLALSNTTSSATVYSVQIPAGGYYELPNAGAVYTGVIKGIWASANGNARVTELT